MDGRTSPSRKLITLLCAAALPLLSSTLLAQAMGKAVLDPAAAVSADVGMSSSSGSSNGATAATPAATTVPSTIATTPVAPASPPPVATISTATTATTAAAAATDSLPPDPAKAIAALRPIEHQEIHPRSADSAATAPAASVLPSGTTSVVQVITALAVVIGLIFLGKALAKKFVPSAKIANPKGVIEILARYPLSRSQSLVLVRIGSQIVTLNQGKDQSQSVLVISDPNEVAKILGQIEGKIPNSIQAGFNKLLANARMDLEDTDPEQPDFEARSMQPENLDNQLEEMAAAKRQLMELRQQVRSVRDSLPR